jgi:hypothetical protein
LQKINMRDKPTKKNLWIYSIFYYFIPIIAYNTCIFILNSFDRQIKYFATIYQ